MKLFTTAFTFLLVFGCGIASPVVNEYIETVLNTAFANEVRTLNFDPSPLSDFESEFEDKVKIIGDVKVKAEFYNGSLTGLSKAKRHSECKADLSTNQGLRSIKCTISFDKVGISYHGKMKYGKMPRLSIHAEGKMTDTLVDIEVVQSIPMMPNLKTFSISKMGTLKMKFTGVGPFNKRVKKILEEKFGQYVQANIFTSISQKINYALNRAVTQMSLPVFY